LRTRGPGNERTTAMSKPWTAWCGILCTVILAASSPVRAQDTDVDVARLREKLAAVQEQIQELQDRVLALMKENARLRKRVAEDASGDEEESAGEPAPQERSKPVTAEAELLHAELVKQGTALGLMETDVTQLREETGREELQQWATRRNVIGHKVRWQVTLLSADDVRTRFLIPEATRSMWHARDRLQAAQLNLAVLKKDRAKMEDVEKAETEVRKWDRTLKERTAALRDFERHPIEVTASTRATGQVFILAHVHKDDKEIVSGLPLDSEFTLTGTIVKVGYERAKTGTVTFPIELAGCRVAAAKR